VGTAAVGCGVDAGADGALLFDGGAAAGAAGAELDAAGFGDGGGGAMYV
jgi:hypothetical protein